MDPVSLVIGLVLGGLAAVAVMLTSRSSEQLDRLEQRLARLEQLVGPSPGPAGASLDAITRIKPGWRPLHPHASVVEEVRPADSETGKGSVVLDHSQAVQELNREMDAQSGMGY